MRADRKYRQIRQGILIARYSQATGQAEPERYARRTYFDTRIAYQAYLFEYAQGPLRKQRRRRREIMKVLKPLYHVYAEQQQRMLRDIWEWPAIPWQHPGIKFTRGEGWPTDATDRIASQVQRPEEHGTIGGGGTVA